jgi:hypothetical protein
MMREILYTLILQFALPKWIEGKDTETIAAELRREERFADLDISEGLVANALAWGRDNGKLARAA